MSENHDPRCEGGSDADQKVLSDIAKYDWHVMRVLETNELPGWAYSIGLYKNFGHPEIVIFGLNADLMHYVINAIGEDVRQGKKFESNKQYADLIDEYQCTLRTVKPKWYPAFLGFASWVYEGDDYPVLQCFWPDFNGAFPWDSKFDPKFRWNQPLLFHVDLKEARAEFLVGNMSLDAAD